MNASSQPRPVELPSLPSEYVQRWMEKTQDLVFLLDELDHIAYVFQDGTFHRDDAHHWIGQSLHSVVSVESRVKIPLLLDNDAARDDSDARWRHINLLGCRDNNIPILARYMRFPGDRPFTRTVFCRDLRAVQEISQRFLSVQQELEQSHQAWRRDLMAKERQLTQGQPAIHISGVVASIKKSTYAQAIRDTVTHLERQCLQALLDDARGDPARAADLAGLTLEEWLAKKAALDEHTD